MSRDFDDLDFDLDDEDLPLVEIEFDDEEDGKSGKVGTVLKVLLIILIVGALLAAGFFVVRYVLGQQAPEIEITSTVTPEPTEVPSVSSIETTGPADTDASAIAGKELGMDHGIRPLLRLRMRRRLRDPEGEVQKDDRLCLVGHAGLCREQLLRAGRREFPAQAEPARLQQLEQILYKN